MMSLMWICNAQLPCFIHKGFTEGREQSRTCKHWLVPLKWEIPIRTSTSTCQQMNKQQQQQTTRANKQTNIKTRARQQHGNNLATPHKLSRVISLHTLYINEGLVNSHGGPRHTQMSLSW